jgi:hypothetical protein
MVKRSWISRMRVPPMQGGGGLVWQMTALSLYMAVGKLSKTAKKRAKTRLEKLAAARTEAERHAVLSTRNRNYQNRNYQ